ncbi:MAG: putative two-component system response regulator [Acidimicrobiaceae bacterium]|nr:putative two-component system response regulator [Acidimicrobiaceae bacterium]
MLTADFDVIGEAENGDEAVRLASELQPDVVLMDIRMPGIDGIEAARQSVARAGDQIAQRAQDLATRMLMLTTFDLDEYVYDCLRAGASGFLLKDEPADQLIVGIRMVADGDALLAPSITKRLIEEFAIYPAGAEWLPELSELTPRELGVFRPIARGMSNNEIALPRSEHDQGARHSGPDQAPSARSSSSRGARTRSGCNQSGSLLEDL